MSLDSHFSATLAMAGRNTETPQPTHTLSHEGLQTHPGMDNITRGASPAVMHESTTSTGRRHYEA